MSIEDNPFLRMQKACQGSCQHPSYPVGEERCYNEEMVKRVNGKTHWTKEQLKKMEQSGFFEHSKRIHIFGKTYFIRPSDYNALVTMLLWLMLIMSVGTILAFLFVTRAQ